MNKVIIFSAPSGSGKTTLVKHALEKFPNLEFSISCTTRAPRGEEKNGVDYYFLTTEDFKNKINNNDFIEYEEVYTDNFYGTLQSEVDRIWADDKIVIFDIDVQGGMNLKNFFGDKALSIFIKAPSIQDLESRLNNRGTDDAQTIAMRIQKAEEELSHQDQFDIVIVNDDLNSSKKEIESTINTFINA